MQYKIFGCKVNKFYINKRLGYFDQNNLSNDPNYLIATCVVTDRAKNKRLKDVIKNLKSGKNVYITGCGVFDRGKLIEQDKFYSIYPELKPFQNQIFLLPETPNYGNNETIKQLNNETGSETETCLTTVRSRNPLKTDQVAGIKHSNNLYTRKFILIQNGCDNFCTFCLTIMKRGKHRSRPLKEIIDEINDFSSSGGKEIVLTGVNLAARGCDNTNQISQSKFSYLLQEILDQTTIPRIRISSIGPEYLDDDFFDIINNPRIMPHFHISIQHFSDKILKAMNRNYDNAHLTQILSKFQTLKRPDLISIGADIIVGFPGETQADFQQLLDSISKYNITKVHEFPFSGHHKGESIPASRFDKQVSNTIKLSRKKQLNLIADQVRTSFIDQNRGLHHSVLVESRKNGKWQGWTSNYIQVQLDGDYNKGEIVSLDSIDPIFI